jgi:drug/metabolite transporter (DMT)-like permease
VAALFGAALGVIFLKEKHGMTRMIGAVILTLGLILVGLAK